MRQMTYYLLAEENLEGAEQYGVRSETGDRAEVRKVTISSRSILELLGLLMRNTVTPVGLRDVIEDWLAW
jgi:hypothetical protein